MRFTSPTKRTAGFTLIEVLIIAPIVILTIGGFVGLMVNMASDMLLTRDQNNMVYETQDVLDRIEQDTRLSTQFLTTSGTFTAPQGSDSNFTGTAAFTNTTSTLILGGLTTDKNPTDASRQLIFYAGQPNVCGSLQSYNRPFLQKIMYFIKGGSLWRRAVLPDYNTNATLDDNTVCAAPWQRNTCSPGYSLSTRCQTNDTELMQNVDSFSIKYFATPTSTTDIGATQALAATTIEVTVGGKKVTAGRDIATSSSIRATKLNNIDVDIPAPGTPTLSTQVVDSTSVNFTWAKVPLASSYVLSYNINGGAWVNAVTDSQTTIYNIGANLGDTVTMRVAARNSTGVSPNAEVAVTIPFYTACTTINSWVNYDNGYATAGYTKTIGNVVVLKGLVRNGATAANTPICTLPVGYRPDKRLAFITGSQNGAVSGTGRIDIAANGEVRFVSGSNGWISLDGIRFIPSTASYAWSATTLQSGWTDYGGSGDTNPHETTLDNQGRVHLRGHVAPGTTTAGAVLFNLPAGQTRATQVTYLPAAGANGFNWNAYSGGVDARSNPGAWLSLQAMFYPGVATGWTSLGLSNSWAPLASHATAEYKKSADKVVTLKGMITKGVNDDGTVIATLPAGYRPKEQLLTSCVAYGAYCRIDILPDGRIVDTFSANNGWVSLDNISFIAEQ
jgi:hypothetical protein